MLKSFKSSYFISFILIYIVSFGEEFASVTYAFALVKGERMSDISMIMMAYLIGGMLSTPCSIYLLDRVSLFTLLCAIFLLSGITIIVTSYFIHSYVTYIVSLLLGLFAALFWSTLAIIVANIFEKNQLQWVNKVTHSIRNIGYVASPSLAGFVNNYFDPKPVLCMTGGIFLLGIPMLYALLPSYKDVLSATSKQKEKTGEGSYFVHNLVVYTRNFLQLPKMNKIIYPLFVTISATSTCNVALLYLVVNILHRSKAFYGSLGSLTSLGLVIGPFLFTSLFTKKGEPFGVCIAASVMGICVLANSIYILPFA